MILCGVFLGEVRDDLIGSAFDGFVDGQIVLLSKGANGGVTAPGLAGRVEGHTILVVDDEGVALVGSGDREVFVCLVGDTLGREGRVGKLVVDTVAAIIIVGVGSVTGRVSGVKSVWLEGRRESSK